MCGRRIYIGWVSGIIGVDFSIDPFQKHPTLSNLKFKSHRQEIRQDHSYLRIGKKRGKRIFSSHDRLPRGNRGSKYLERSRPRYLSLVSPRIRSIALLNVRSKRRATGCHPTTGDVISLEVYTRMDPSPLTKRKLVESRRWPRSSALFSDFLPALRQINTASLRSLKNLRYLLTCEPVFTRFRKIHRSSSFASTISYIYTLCVCNIPPSLLVKKKNPRYNFEGT